MLKYTLDFRLGMVISVVFIKTFSSSEAYLEPGQVSICRFSAKMVNDECISAHVDPLRKPTFMNRQNFKQ